MNRPFDHLLLTRFNVKIKFLNPAGRDWMIHRFHLFKQYCFPSVLGQTNRDFKWLVFFDEETADEFRLLIEKYATWKNFIPCYVGPPVRSNIFSLVRQHMRPDAEYLITSRLDNDDAVAIDYIEKIQNVFQSQKFEFISFVNGYVCQEGKVYQRRYPYNPFVSLIEKVEKDEQIKTVFFSKHGDIASLGPVKEIRKNPLWLQVVHERNLCNEANNLKRLRKSFLKGRFILDNSFYDSPDPLLMIFFNNFLYSLRYLLSPVKRQFKKIITSFQYKDIKQMKDKISPH